MAIANVAHGGAVTNATAGTTQAVTVTVATGDFILVCVSTTSLAPASSVTDNATGGSNKYYEIADNAGSNRISMWYCPSSKSAVTTVTATTISSRRSVSVSTWTGVLGVGQWKTATNAANNNTITLNNALGAGNLMVACMGDATGTQTWTAVTGTLRNNIAGAGSTTPGSTNMENAAGNTCAASLSVSVTGEAIAIELLSVAAPNAMDLWDSNQFALTPPASLGTLKLYSELEPFNWGHQVPGSGGGAQMSDFKGQWALRAGMDPVENFGFKIPVVVTAISAFDEQDMQIAQALELQVAYQEDDPTIYQPVGTSTGMQMGAWRGWSSRGGMDPVDNFGFVQVVATTLPAFDEDQYLLRVGALQQEDDWSFNPPVIVSAISAFDEDQFAPMRIVDYEDDDLFGFDLPFAMPQEEVSLSKDITKYQYDDQGIVIGFSDSDLQGPNPSSVLCIGLDEDIVNSTFFSLEQFSDDDLQSPVSVSSRYQEDDVFGFQTPVVVVNLPWDTEYNPSLNVINTRDNPDDQPSLVITGYMQEDSPLALITDYQWTDDDTAQSTFFALEQYADVDEQFVSPVRIQYHDDDLVFASAFVDSDPQTPLSISRIVDDLDQFGFKTAVVQATAFDEDQSVYTGMSVREDVEQFAFSSPFVGGASSNLMGFRGFWSLRAGMGSLDDVSYKIAVVVQNASDESNYDYITNFKTLSYNDDESSYEPAIAQNPLDESNYDYFPNFKSLSYNDDEFSYEPAIAQNPYDESAYDFINLLRSFYNPSLESDQDTSQSTFFALEQFSDDGSQDIIKQWWIVPDDTDIEFLVFPPGVLPTSFYDADFNPTVQRSYLFNNEDIEKFNWGWLPPPTKVNEDDSPYDSLMMRSYFNPSLDSDYDSAQSTFFAREQFADADEQASFRTYGWDVDEQLTYNFDFGFEDIQDKLPVPLVTQDVEEFGFQTPVVVTAITPFDIDQFLLPVNLVRQDAEEFGFQTPTVSVITPFDFDQNLVQSSNIFQDNDPTPVLIAVITEIEQYVEQQTIKAQQEDVVLEAPFLNQVFADDFYQQPSNPFIVDVDEQVIFRTPDGVQPYDGEDNPPFQRSFYVPEIDEDFAFISFVAPTFIPVIHNVTVSAVMGLMSNTRLKVKGGVTVTPQAKVKP